MAKATTMKILPFIRLTKNVLKAYQSHSMAADILAGISLRRVDNFHTKSKKAQMRHELLEEAKV